MAFSIRYEDSDAFIRGQMEYWSQVSESEGFDLENISVPLGTTGLMPFDCEREDVRYPDPILVNRYARFGLHRYNMGHDSNLQLHHLKKFNQTMICQSTYYMTLVACDPASSALVNLQVGVAEGSRKNCTLNLSCFIARRQGTASEPFKFHNTGLVNDAQLPYWPSDFNARFYEVSKSELQNEDWIRLFLELTICSGDRGIEDSELSRLEIVKAVIETTEGNQQALQATAATVYITFKGLALARVGELGEHVERRVIVKRAIDERSGCFTLHGGYGLFIGEVAEQRYISRSRPTGALIGDQGHTYQSRTAAAAPPLRSVFARKVRRARKASS